MQAVLNGLYQVKAVLAKTSAKYFKDFEPYTTFSLSLPITRLAGASNGMYATMVTVQVWPVEGDAEPVVFEISVTNLSQRLQAFDLRSIA